mgnify:CR=1 FL=1
MDVKEMDNTFVSSRDFISDVYAFSQPKDIGIFEQARIDLLKSRLHGLHGKGDAVNDGGNGD